LAIKEYAFSARVREKVSIPNGGAIKDQREIQGTRWGGYRFQSIHRPPQKVMDGMKDVYSAGVDGLSLGVQKLYKNQETKGEVTPTQPHNY